MPEALFQRVAVVGVGLIGGSVALASRALGVAGRTVGVSSTGASAERVRGLGIVDQATDDLRTGVEGADLVVVCTPIDAIVEKLSAAQSAAPDALLTDAGSTKAGIVAEAATRLADPGRFVGAHPLAGDHRTGPEAARADLFAGATTIVTPTDLNQSDAVSGVTSFWEALGSRVEQMPPESHDRVVAASSHLPHVAAAAVAGCTPDEAAQFVATGWADTTRVAAGSPALWREILLANRAAVGAEIGRLADCLAEYREALAAGDGDRLTALLEEGRRRRDAVGD